MRVEAVRWQQAGQLVVVNGVVKGAVIVCTKDGDSQTFRGPSILSPECSLPRNSAFLLILPTSYLLFHVCLSHEHLFSKAHLPLSFDSPAILIKDLPGEQAAILTNCQQELIIKGEQHLWRQGAWRRSSFLRPACIARAGLATGQVSVRATLHTSLCLWACVLSTRRLRQKHPGATTNVLAPVRGSQGLGERKISSSFKNKEGKEVRSSSGTYHTFRDDFLVHHMEMGRINWACALLASACHAGPCFSVVLTILME